jgi:hypothetical protein
VGGLGLFSGDLAAHEGLDKPQIDTLGFTVAAFPPEVLVINVPYLKQDDGLAPFRGTGKPVGGAGHNGRPGYIARIGGVPVLGNDFSAPLNIFFEPCDWHSNGEFSGINPVRKQNYPKIKKTGVECFGDGLSRVSSCNDVWAKRGEQFNVRCGRFADVGHIESDVDANDFFIESKWTNNFGGDRNPSPVGRDQCIFSDSCAFHSGVSADFSSSRCHRRIFHTPAHVAELDQKHQGLKTTDNDEAKGEEPSRIFSEPSRSSEFSIWAMDAAALVGGSLLGYFLSLWLWIWPVNKNHSSRKNSDRQKTP